MAVSYRVDVVCTNKLCDHRGYTHLPDRRTKEKLVCPKCGFKTLAQVGSLARPVTSNPVLGGKKRPPMSF